MRPWLPIVFALCVSSQPASALQSGLDLSIPEFHGTPLTTTFGGFDAPAREALGKIADLRVSHALDVFVLDEYYHEVKWFGSDGRLRVRLGGAGQGPGELSHPIALDLSSTEDQLYILDRGNIRISIVDLRQPEAGARAWVRIPMPAVDFCITDDVAFLLLETGEAVVHAFDLEQERITASWGVPADVSQLDGQAGQDSARETMGATQLECSVDKDVMILASPMRGRIWAYRLSGDLMWSVDLPDYYRSNVVPVEVGGRSGYTFEMEGPNYSFHSIHRLLFKDRSVLVQATKMDMTINEPGWGEVTTFELDLATGRVMEHTIGLPLIAGWTEDSAVVWTNGPTPAVGITNAEAVSEVVR